jgi:hypothetical protein
MTQAALLVEAAVPWVQPFQTLQRRQGLGYAPQVAQARGLDQQEVTVFRQAADQATGVPQGFLMPAILLELSQPSDFLLD